MGMKHLIALIALVLAGCSKEVPYDYGVASGSAPGPTIKTIQLGADCTQTGSAAYAFKEWGVLDANLYSCPVYNKMNCQVAVTLNASNSEMNCQTINPTDMQGVPQGCVEFAHGTRSFWSAGGALKETYAYNCGVMFEALRCVYYLSADGLNEEVTCKDNQLPYP